MKKAVFLDRDGTLVAMIGNRGPRSRYEIKILPGVWQGCKLLLDNDYLLTIVTNQPDIARGLTTQQDQTAINNQLASMLGLSSRWFMCRHDDTDDCICRKPKPGLIYAAAHALEIRLADSWLIGDNQPDAEAAGAGHVRYLLTNGNFRKACQWIVNSSESTFTVTAEILRTCKKC